MSNTFLRGSTPLSLPHWKSIKFCDAITVYFLFLNGVLPRGSAFRNEILVFVRYTNVRWRLFIITLGTTHAVLLARCNSLSVTNERLSTRIGNFCRKFNSRSFGFKLFYEKYDRYTISESPPKQRRKLVKIKPHARAHKHTTSPPSNQSRELGLF